MPHRQVVFTPGVYYHLYNRGSAWQAIFLEFESYLYFLRQFRRHRVKDTLDGLAYCLMPNHYRPAPGNTAQARGDSPGDRYRKRLSIVCGGIGQPEPGYVPSPFV